MTTNMDQEKTLLQVELKDAREMIRSLQEEIDFFKRNPENNSIWVKSLLELEQIRQTRYT